jgi:molecular chaperone HscB
MQSTCPECGARPSSPLSCQACGALLEPARDATPFELLGEPVRYDVDAAALRPRLLRLARRIHPDFFAGAGADLRRRAEENSALLNAAFELLGDDARRADWLVRSLGGPSEEEERGMPAPFLAEVLEWNEAIESARDAAPGAPERAALDELEARLRAERAQVLLRIGELLTPLPPRGAPALIEARRKLNAARYLERALQEISELRLVQARAR